LRDRLLTYFTKGPADKKEQRVAAHAARLVWEVQPHELLALLRELELIRAWRPRLNARGRPGRHEIGYIYISGGLAPNLRAGRRIPENAAHHWGPLVLNRRVRSAVAKLNHLFQLRDCPDRTPVRYAEQLTLLAGDDHPACVRGELGTCLAPCTGLRGQDDYVRNLFAARALLDGHDLSLIEQQQQRMLEAAQRQEYERAAAYRDTWESLRLLHDQLAILRSGQRDCWFVYPFAKTAGSATSRTHWLIVAGGLAAAIVPEPRTASAADRVTQLLETITRDHQLTHPDEVAQLRVVAGWFRQHPEERAATISIEQARARCCEVWGFGQRSDRSD
jgi:excinuclease ABC subunit C